MVAELAGRHITAIVATRDAYVVVASYERPGETRYEVAQVPKSGGAAKRLFPPPDDPITREPHIATDGDAVYVNGISNSVYRIDRAGEPIAILRDVYRVSGIAVVGGTVVVSGTRGSKDGLHAVARDGSSAPRMLTNEHETRYAGAEIAAVPGGRSVVATLGWYDHTREGSELVVLRVDDSDSRTLARADKADRFVEVAVVGNHVLASTDARVLFDVSFDPKAQPRTRPAPGYLACAANGRAFVSTPLTVVDVETGATKPVSDAAVVCAVDGDRLILAEPHGPHGERLVSLPLP